MTFITFTLTSIGGLLLSHAIYSAHEHSLLPATSFASPLSSTSTPPLTKPVALTPTLALPTDILLETLIGTLLLIFSIVFSAPPLRPIRWSAWAGKIEREGWDPRAEDRKDEAWLAKGGVGNPYLALEKRKGFWDVRGSREAFGGFIREK